MVKKITTSNKRFKVLSSQARIKKPVLIKTNKKNPIIQKNVSNNEKYNNYRRAVKASDAFFRGHTFAYMGLDNKEQKRMYLDIIKARKGYKKYQQKVKEYKEYEKNLKNYNFSTIDGYNAYVTRTQPKPIQYLKDSYPNNLKIIMEHKKTIPLMKKIEPKKETLLRIKHVNKGYDKELNVPITRYVATIKKGNLIYDRNITQNEIKKYYPKETKNIIDKSSIRNKILKKGDFYEQKMQKSKDYGTASGIALATGGVLAIHDMIHGIYSGLKTVATTTPKKTLSKGYNIISNPIKSGKNIYSTAKGISRNMKENPYRSIGYLGVTAATLYTDPDKNLARKITNEPKIMKNTIAIINKNTMSIKPIKKYVIKNDKVLYTDTTGSVTTLKPTQGYIQHIRKGKNWNEKIIVDNYGNAQGYIIRNLKTGIKRKTKNYRVEYTIKNNIIKAIYKRNNKIFYETKNTFKPKKMVLQEGIKKSVPYNKKVSTITDSKGITYKKIPNTDFYLATNNKIYSRGYIDNLIQKKDFYSAKESFTPIKYSDSKTNIIGKKFESNKNLQRTYIQPMEIQEAITYGKKVGNNKLLQQLKRITKIQDKTEGSGKIIDRTITKEKVMRPNEKLEYSKRIKPSWVDTLQYKNKNVVYEYTERKIPRINRIIQNIKAMEPTTMSIPNKRGSITIKKNTKIKIPKEALHKNIDDFSINKEIYSFTNKLKYDTTAVQLLKKVKQSRMRNKTKNKILENIEKQLQKQLQLKKMKKRFLTKSLLRKSFAKNKTSTLINKKPNLKRLIPKKPKKFKKTFYSKKKKSYNKNKKKSFYKEEYNEISRMQDPYLRISGKAKYSQGMNKLLRERYGTTYS